MESFSTASSRIAAKANTLQSPIKEQRAISSVNPRSASGNIYHPHERGDTDEKHINRPATAWNCFAFIWYGVFNDCSTPFLTLHSSWPRSFGDSRLPAGIHLPGGRTRRRVRRLL